MFWRRLQKGEGILGELCIQVQTITFIAIIQIEIIVIFKHIKPFLHGNVLEIKITALG